MLRQPKTFRLKSVGTVLTILSAFGLAYSLKPLPSETVKAAANSHDPNLQLSSFHASEEGDYSKGDLALFAFKLHPVDNAKPGSYEEMSRVLSKAEWALLPAADRRVARQMLLDARKGHTVIEPCFAPGTKPAVISAFSKIGKSLSLASRSLRAGNNELRTDGGARWTQTASNPSIAAGAPFTLTWNLAKDGARENDANGAVSNIRAWAATTYGSEESFRQVIRDMFARYEKLTGIHYVEVNYDDGAPIFSSPGALDVRADIRIGGKRIDGDYGVLGYNAFPNSGDMMLDTEDSFFRDAGTGVGLFNTLAHEHGHGLGLGHTCPGNGTKLMEPALNSGFKGPQLDDIQAVQYNYGDGFEQTPRNNALENAVDLGSLNLNGEKAVDEQSINATSTDVDYFKFMPDALNRTITVQVVPRGQVYLEGPQNDDGSCSAGSDFDPRNKRNLSVSILSNTGAVIATSADTGIGTTKIIENVKVTTLVTPLVVRVVALDTTTAVQGYVLRIKENLYIDPTPTPTTTPAGTPTPAPTVTPVPTATPVPLPIGSIAFTEPTYSVNENGRQATISVQRVVRNNQGRTGAVSVKYQTTTTGTATAGADYTAVTGTLSWANGDSTVKTFTVPILDDTIRENNETVGLRLYDLVGTGTIAPTRQTAVLTIVDNETGALDKTAPRVAITKPSFSALNVDLIQGTATDTGGTGVASVVLYIQRPFDNQYWSGTAWTRTKTALTTQLSGSTWTRSSGNPPKTSIAGNILIITANATDRAGNVGAATLRTIVDSTAPAVYIQVPFSGARLKTLGRVSGTVSDAEGDSTLVISLRRSSDRKFWTGVGNNWATNATPLPVNLMISGEWNRSIWPTLTAGNYTLIATGTDEVGNSTSATTEFSIVSTNPSVAGS
ncbi:matrixin family metalloprotease [bacterium]|nr:MAG: matrixin family metalloprotease [bacterium]